MLPVQQALVQILLCRGVVEDAKAQKLLLALGKDFELGNTALTEHFKCINNSIRNLGLEIRTVVLGEGGNRVFYHGMSFLSINYMFYAVFFTFTLGVSNTVSVGIFLSCFVLTHYGCLLYR